MSKENNIQITSCPLPMKLFNQHDQRFLLRYGKSTYWHKGRHNQPWQTASFTSSAGWNVNNYKLCKEVTEEIQAVIRQQHKFTEEVTTFSEGERKACFYQEKKRNSKHSATNITSDIPVSSLPSVLHSTVNLETDSDDGEYALSTSWLVKLLVATLLMYVYQSSKHQIIISEIA